MPHNEYEDKTEEKTADARRSVKIGALKAKGMSEKDATVKGLTDMKRVKKSEEATDPVVSENKLDEPDYPYGLKVRLEKDDLEKLGLSELPEVGTTIKITADAVVDGVSSSNYKSGGDNKSVELQITSMQIDAQEPGMTEQPEMEVPNAVDEGLF